jgi:hypothetical protein
MKCPLSDPIISNIIHTASFTLHEIRNGISKRVYRVTTADSSYILYVWLRPFDGALTENKTPGTEFLFPDGFQYFLYNTQLLTDLGVRVPKILSSGHDAAGGFDYALVEFLRGRSFDEYLQSGGDLSRYADQLTGVMNRLSAQKRDYFGVPMEKTRPDVPAETLAYQFYAEELRIASELDKEVFFIRDKMNDLLKSKQCAVKPYSTRFYPLVHGELTPPHIFILEDDSLAMIDFEALKYFDREYDWAVIDCVYGGKFSLPSDLDAARFDFYQLCVQIGYLSVAVDYLINVDCADDFFQNLRKYYLNVFQSLK